MEAKNKRQCAPDESRRIGKIRGPDDLFVRLFCKVHSCCHVSTLANDEARPIFRATVPYAPLHRNSSFIAAFERFRSSERKSLETVGLFQRGVEHVVQSALFFESWRSSEDRAAEDRGALLKRHFQRLVREIARGIMVSAVFCSSQQFCVFRIAGGSAFREFRPVGPS